MGTLANHNTQIPTSNSDARIVNPSSGNAGNVSRHHHDDVQSSGAASKGSTGNVPDGSLDTPGNSSV